VSIEKLQANYPVQISYVVFPLHPETPLEGQSLEDLFAGRDITPMRERMKKLMAEAGLPYSNRTHTYNSRAAQELAKWAETQEGGAAIHDALYHAYFVDNLNIADDEVLMKLVAKLGLDPQNAREALHSGEFSAAVDADWQRSRELGITGVPTFYSSDLMVVGCQPYEVLEKFVNHLQELNNDD